jgi:hypothetical protein
MNAHQWTIEGMQKCLPPNVPLPFTVESAKFVKKHVALARVTMFDGLTGTLQVSQEPCGVYVGWCIQWFELSGGAINWNGECWERVCHSSEKRVEQMELWSA